MADAGLIVLATITVFLLLASPIITYVFSVEELLVWTFAAGIPLGLIGVILNHRAKR